MNYEPKAMNDEIRNEPKTNPKRTQSNPIKANKMPKQNQYEPNLSRRSLSRSQIKPTKSYSLSLRDKLGILLEVRLKSRTEQSYMKIFNWKRYH